jgi:hypothetical protein
MDSASANKKPRGDWTPEEIAREERVTRLRVMERRALGVTANLEDASALTRAANIIADAFKHARST